MQSRLQRLILQVQPAARLLRAQPLRCPAAPPARDRSRAARATAASTAVRSCRRSSSSSGMLRPVRRMPRARSPCRSVGLAASHDRAPRPRARGRVVPQPRHRGVERDAVDPGRQRRVAAKRIDLLLHLEQDVLRHFFGVLTILHVPHRQLHKSASRNAPQAPGLPSIACLQTGDKQSVLGPLHVRSSADKEHRPFRSYSRNLPNPAKWLCRNELASQPKRVLNTGALEWSSWPSSSSPRSSWSTPLYVAAEFAAVSVRRSRIQQLAADGNPLAAWLLPLLESPAALDRYIGACQIGITLSSLVLGAYAQSTFAVWLTPVFAALGGLQELAAQSTSAAVVLLALTTAQVVFGSSCRSRSRCSIRRRRRSTR